jgi:tRNA(fMet)-specific endonuclease VapC
VLTYYEIISGLKYRDARKQLNYFMEFCQSVSIIPLTEDSSERSAEIYASLRSRGEIIDDVDILIAGICIEGDYTLVTNNTKHFSRINGLRIENWCE